MSNRMTFPELYSPLRTDSSFRNRIDEDYNTNECPFLGTSIDLVKGVPLDYMHLVCLGVMKRLVTFWMKDFIITTAEKDNCVILRNDKNYCIQAIFQNNEKVIYLYGTEYVHIAPLYDNPCNSSEIFNISIVKNIGDIHQVSKIISVQDVKHKCMKLPHSDEDTFLIIPLLHNELLEH